MRFLTANPAYFCGVIPLPDFVTNFLEPRLSSILLKSLGHMIAYDICCCFYGEEAHGFSSHQEAVPSPRLESTSKLRSAGHYVACLGQLVSFCLSASVYFEEKIGRFGGDKQNTIVICTIQVEVYGIASIYAQARCPTRDASCRHREAAAAAIVGRLLASQKCGPIPTCQARHTECRVRAATAGKRSGMHQMLSFF